MYKSLHLFPYKVESNSARMLSAGLGIKMVRHDPVKSKFRGSKDKLMINWGWSCGPFPNPEVEACTVINHPSIISRATNKLSFFQTCSNVMDGKDGPRIPRWTTNKDEARHWIVDEKRVVFARTVLNGNSGEGIVEVTNEEELNAVREGTLLVEYVPKRIEYRVHVCGGEPFDIQRKAFNNERREEGPNWRVRNLANGFVFVRNDVGRVPDDVYTQAVLACNKIGLDFGAVDVIWNERRNSAYVLEVNCAPGLEGTTLQNYIDKFKSIFKKGIENV